MSDHNLANRSATLVGLLQSDFPLVREPYRALAERLGTTEESVINDILRLKQEGAVRQISPVIDARRLGFQSTLVAMKIAGPALARAEEIIAAHPGVSHGYERTHEFNVWFTLSLPSTADVEEEVERLRGQTGAETAFSLPVLKLFKIGAFFDTGGDAPVVSSPHAAALPSTASLTLAERCVINTLQQDLPLSSTPFDRIAMEARMDITAFLDHCRSLIERGVIRRYGASVNHRRVGFQANAMTCWAMPSEAVDDAGNALASLKAVSHCYERKQNCFWRYNLFAMVHATCRETCEAMVNDMAEKIGVNDYVMLYSTREFKKTRIVYRV